MSTMRVIAPNLITEAGIVSYNVAEDEHPQWDAATPYETGDRRILDHVIYEAVKATANSSTVAIRHTRDQVYWPGHGLVNGTPLFIDSSDVLPAPLVQDAVYYVRDRTVDTFKLAAVSGGAAVNLTSAGTGVITAAASSNINRDPRLVENRAGPVPYWRRVSSTNRHKMLDESSSSQTENPEAIVIRLACGAADSVFLDNLVAAAVNIKSFSGGVERKNVDVDLRVNNVTNLWEYFFYPVIRRTTAVTLALPPYATGEILITISNPGSVAKCGACVVGMSREIGELQWAPEFRRLSSSKKSKNVFLDTTLVPGKIARLMTCRIFLENAALDEWLRLLDTYDGRALAWIGSEEYSATQIRGFYRDLRAVLEGPGGSFCSLEIEEIS